jgi:hypothetical protein
MFSLVCTSGWASLWHACTPAGNGWVPCVWPCGVHVGGHGQARTPVHVCQALQVFSCLRKLTCMQLKSRVHACDAVPVDVCTPQAVGGCWCGCRRRLHLLSPDCATLGGIVLQAASVQDCSLSTIGGRMPYRAILLICSAGPQPGVWSGLTKTPRWKYCRPGLEGYAP